ncbi:exported hypothetical protein [Agrobacterium deltaense RV3]|nr:exported hypothetical protein [Agrobacterium deltaense RV3]
MAASRRSRRSQSPADALLKGTMVAAATATARTVLAAKDDMVCSSIQVAGRCQLQIRWLTKYSPAAERALNELWQTGGGPQFLFARDALRARTQEQTGRTDEPFPDNRQFRHLA